MNKTIGNSFALFFAVIILILLTSGVYRHDTPIEKYLELANQKEFDCVGRIYQSSSDDWVPSGVDMKFTNLDWRQAGSCIIIDSLHILTAAHLVTGENKKDTVVSANGMNVLTYVVTSKYVRPVADFWFLIMNQTVKAKKITCYPDYLLSIDYNNDLAIIELEHPILNAPTILLNSNTDELNDTITGIGFGASGPANAAALVQNYNIKLAGQNIIDSIGGIKRNNLATNLFTDFDCPKGYANCSKLGSKIALPLEYGIKGGDSGGPIFRRKNDRLELIGILSGSNGALPNSVSKIGYYGQIDNWTRISAYHDWIMSNLK